MIDKFYDSFQDVVGFDYKDEWDVLMGVEKPVDYVRELVGNLDSLPRYDKKIHLDGKFTGFVKGNKENIFVPYFGNKMSDFAYLEKGKIKYIQCHEGFESLYSKKFYFFDENFMVHKGYGSNNDGKLSYVFRNSNFELDDLSLKFSRLGRESSDLYVSVSSVGSGFPFMNIGIPSDFANSLSDDVFFDYSKFVDYFSDFNVSLFGKFDWLKKKFDFLKGLDIIREESSVKK